MPLIFPVIHVGTVTTAGTFQKQEQRDSFPSTTELLAVRSVRKEKQQLCLCADLSPQQAMCRAPAGEPADQVSSNNKHHGLPAFSLVQKAC